MTTQEKILDRYKEIRGDFIDTKDEKLRQEFFDNLLKYNYLKHINPYINGKILEIGCNKGYMLKALQGLGFKNLYGIDLSNSDLSIAKNRTELDTLKQENAFDNLKYNKYDLILCKDVMEHIQKDRQEEFVKEIYNSLNIGGTAIIQVPNMDWIMSNHERYMDFTHEVGYTRESLADIFRLYFAKVEVLPASYIFKNSKKKIVVSLVRSIMIKCIRFALRILGEGASDVWFEHREIMVVAKKDK